MAVLEFNDWQLTRRDDAGVTLEREPAAASAAGGSLVFGAAALARSRSHPQQFNNRYLHTLSADPVAGDLGQARNHADLVYQHLLSLDLSSDESVTLAIPGYLTNDQLGLLLGICQEAGHAVNGFVETALAQTLHFAPGSVTHVLDIELYRLCLSEIGDEGDQRRIVRSSSMDGLGVANLVEGWMNVIADEFVHKTRFDPLHAGAVEQQLFDQVYGWLGHSDLADARIRVSQGEAIREMDVSARVLQEKLTQRLKAADFSAVTTLALSPRVQEVPGLLQALRNTGLNLAPVHEEEIAANFAALNESMDPNNVRRVTSAAILANGSAPPMPEDAVHPATHLLADHIAVALSNKRFATVYDLAGGGCQDTNMLVNGQTPTPGQVLMPGDRVVCLGSEFTAIRLE